jgi:hypothetical protein
VLGRSWKGEFGHGMAFWSGLDGGVVQLLYNRRGF